MKPKLTVEIGIGSLKRQSIVRAKILELIDRPEYQELFADLVDRVGNFDVRVWFRAKREPR